MPMVNQMHNRYGRTGAGWDHVSDNPVATVGYPTCPDCLTNYEVYCMECETHSVNCSCETDTFWCGQCGEDFLWDTADESAMIDSLLAVHKDIMREKRMDFVLQDDVELVDIQVNRPTEQINGTDYTIYNDECPVCGETQIAHQHEYGLIPSNDRVKFDPYFNPGQDLLNQYGPNNACPNCYKFEDHTCVDARTGEIISWNDKTTEMHVPMCYCNPPKHFICPKCGVERETERDPWEWRDERAGHLADEWVRRQMLGEKAVDEEYDGPTPDCICDPEPAYFCGMCRVTRSAPDEPWKPLHDHKDAVKIQRDKKLTDIENYSRVCSACDLEDWEHKDNKICSGAYWSSFYKTGGSGNTKPKNQVKVPYSGNTKKYGSWEDEYDWMGFYKCRHYGEAVKLADGTIIHCSSLWDTRKDEDVPDRGLYFDWSWKPDWRSELSLWPDFQIPTNRAATANAIIEYYNLAKKGAKIEIGCIGGHGRTGTALACMAVLAGTPWQKAVWWVQSNYCKEAVESKSQEWYVEWFDCYINEKPLPDAPILPVKVTTINGDGSYCTKGEHYRQWLANPSAKECTKRRKACVLYEKDVENFEEGKVEEWVVKNALAMPVTSEYTTIDGYKIPKTKVGERSHTNIGHCTCDYCRYTERGMGAFLEPVGVSHIYISVKDGLLKTAVTPEFTPQPPREDGVAEFQRIGEYVWTRNEGEMVWAWDGIKRAKSTYIKVNAERNKARSDEAKKSGTPMKADPVTSSSAPSKSSKSSVAVLDREDDSEYTTRSNKRNKKNPNRKGGRRRANKRRR